MHFVLRTHQDRARCVTFINSLSSTDKAFSVSVKPYAKNRTLAQNRAFHAICGELAKHKGYSPEEMKVLIKAHFGLFEYVTNKKTGEVIPALKSTASLTVEEFASLITNTEILAAKEGVICQRDEDYYEAIGVNKDSPPLGRQGATREHRLPAETHEGAMM